MKKENWYRKNSRRRKRKRGVYTWGNWVNRNEWSKRRDILYKSEYKLCKIALRKSHKLKKARGMSKESSQQEEKLKFWNFFVVHFCWFGLSPFLYLFLPIFIWKPLNFLKLRFWLLRKKLQKCLLNFATIVVLASKVNFW